MKLVEGVERPQGRASTSAAPGSGSPVDVLESEDRTRDRVCRTVLERGPVSAADLGSELGLTPAAVRRHLDALLSDGMVAIWEAAASTHRGRGRPARRFVLTDAGHAAMASEYDDLARAALRFLQTVAGADAVRQFADERLSDFESRYRPLVEAAGTDPARRAEVLAQALSTEGYSASTRPLNVGAVSVGVQLCQGHCPVQHVAREFPEFCEAETDVFSRLLGVHVQRLATLAHGEHVCTTHVPNVRVPNTYAPNVIHTVAPSTERQSE